MLPYIKKKNNKPYIVYFYTNWCLMSYSCWKEWIKFKKKYDKNFIFKDINVDKHRYLAEKFNINTYPTFLYIGNNIIEKYYGKQGLITLNDKLKKSISL